MEKLEYQLACTFEDSVPPIECIAVGPDFELLAAGCLNRLLIFGFHNKALLYEIIATSNITTLQWVTVTNQLLCGVSDGTIFVVKFGDTQINIFGFSAHHKLPVNCISSLDRLVDGKIYAASSGGDCVKVWVYDSEAHTWNTAFTVARPSPTALSNNRPIIVTALHWSEATQYPNLMVSYKHHGVVGWEWNSLLKVFKPKWSIPLPLCDGFGPSPDSSRIVVCNGSTGFDLYSVLTGVQLGQFPISPTEAENGLPVVFAHGGTAVIGGSKSGKIRVWTSDTFIRMQSFVARGRVLCISPHYHMIQDVFSIICAAHDSEQDKWSISIWSTGDISRK